MDRGHRIQTPTEKLEETASVRRGPPRRPSAGRLDHGTVMVWDRWTSTESDYKPRVRCCVTGWSATSASSTRNFLVATPLTVDGVVVEPCDPLFLTEGFRYYDLDEDRAIELPPATVEVKDKDSGEVVGRMRVRFARMPATFFRRPEFKRTNKPGAKKDMNERLEIADANNGIIFLRNGRQIDVIRAAAVGGELQRHDRPVLGVEVDFDASLDELFSITTSKQQVTPGRRGCGTC